MVSAAYEALADQLEPDVRDRLAGLAEIPGKVTLASLKKACKSNAENGCDPFAMGTVEVGLFLSLDEYEQLVSYAKGLTIVYAKTRRRS